MKRGSILTPKKVRRGSKIFHRNSCDVYCNRGINELLEALTKAYREAVGRTIAIENVEG